MACVLCAVLLPLILRAQAEGTIHQEFRYKLPKPSLLWTTIGGLPSGLQIIGNNEIWGSPNEAGDYKLTLQASDGAQLALGLKVNALWNLSLTPPQAGVGVPFSHELVIRGGTPPYTFGASELPPGLKMLSSDGIIFGTPTAPGAYSVSIVATDSHGSTLTIPYSLTVNSVGILTRDLPPAEPDKPYSQQLTAAGGKPPYTVEAPHGCL